VVLVLKGLDEVRGDDVTLDLGCLGGEHPGWSRHEFWLDHRSGDRVPPWITP
jgi:hypothetical protein